MKHQLNAFRLPTLIAIFLAAIHWSGARVISLSAMQFTDTKTPDPERNYYYTVRAREHSGLISPYSRITNRVGSKYWNEHFGRRNPKLRAWMEPNSRSRLSPDRAALAKK